MILPKQGITAAFATVAAVHHQQPNSILASPFQRAVASIPNDMYQRSISLTPLHLVPNADLHDAASSADGSTSSLKSTIAAGDYFSSPPLQKNQWRNHYMLQPRHVLGFLIRLMTTMTTLGVNLLDERRVFARHKLLQNVVSRLLFWPTLPWIAYQRWGSWSSVIDDTVVLGGVPIHALFGIPRRLQQAHGVSAVLNFCDEYAGPTKEYQRLNIQQLRLPTINHLEPTPGQLWKAVQFLKFHKQTNHNNNSRVYVHCRAGNGRSAAVVLAWLMYQHPDQTPQQLNASLLQQRLVRPNLWQQDNIQQFQQLLLDRRSQKQQQQRPFSNIRLSST